MTMPYLDHVAIWVADLDSARDFYSHWFDGHANGLYENPRTGLRTHILHFAETPAGERGTRLEIMTRPELAEGREAAGLGWAHVSFGLPGREDVDRLASYMSEAGVPVVDGPRETVLRGHRARPRGQPRRARCLRLLRRRRPAPGLLIRKVRPGLQPGHAVREWCALLRC